MVEERRRIQTDRFIVRANWYIDARIIEDGPPLDLEKENKTASTSAIQTIQINLISLSARFALSVEYMDLVLVFPSRHYFIMMLQLLSQLLSLYKKKLLHKKRTRFFPKEQEIRSCTDNTVARLADMHTRIDLECNACIDHPCKSIQDTNRDVPAKV